MTKLENRAALGLEIRHTSEPGAKELEGGGIYRDDHYIFLLIENGQGSMVVDFSKIVLEAGHVYFISPWQIHYNIEMGGVVAWYISVAPALISKEHLEIFESYSALQQPRLVDGRSYQQGRQLAQLLFDQYQEDITGIFYKQLTFVMLNAFLTVIAKAYVSVAELKIPATSRPFQINRKFRRLLSEKLKSEKTPGYYAANLHLSEVYLNEAVKKVTGFTVSHWIQYEITLEAKRLLCYTQLSVKEIAYFLGYKDHAYFSRLFRKWTGSNPVMFRQGCFK